MGDSQLLEIGAALVRRRPQYHRDQAQGVGWIAAAVGANDRAVVAEVVIAIADFGGARVDATRWRRPRERAPDIAADAFVALHDADHVDARIAIDQLSLGDEGEQASNL